MKIEGIPFEVTDWTGVGTTASNGRTGKAISREIDRGDIRLRLVEYSPGYESDHWCAKGHVVWVLEGDLRIELEDGKNFNLKGGMSFVVGDNVAAHKAFSDSGAEVIIVD